MPGPSISIVQQKTRLNSSDIKDIDTLSKRYQSIDESRHLSSAQLKRVVKQVNNISKQMLFDIDAPNLKHKDPLQNYVTSLVAVSDPSIVREEFTNDNTLVHEKQRIKRHQISKAKLQEQILYIIPDQ